MRNALLILILVLVGNLSNAQDLHIYYDVYKDSIFYLKDKLPVKNADLKKGAKAVLHIINYNDYLYEVEVNTEGENYSIPSSGVGKIFSFGGGQESFQELTDAAGSFGISGFQLGENNLTNDREGAVDTEAGASKELVALSKRFERILADMSDIEEEIEELGSDIATKIENQQFLDFKKTEVLELRTNPRLSADKIKEISMKYMEQILGIEKEEPFDLEKMFEQVDPKKVIGTDIKDYKTETAKLEAKFTELAAVNALLVAFSLAPTDEVSFLSSFEEAEKRKNAYREKVLIMEEQMQQIGKLGIKEFADIGYLYEEMKDHRFEKKIILTPEDDLTQISVKLVPIDSLQVAGVKTLELTPLEVSVFGGLKINASVGISFAGFFNRPQAYLVREGRIFADDLDPFSPIVTSFIHFHPQSKKQVSLGGAFGLGIGIGGEGSGLQNYFLGPSLIVGKKQRIVFSTGLMAGKLDRLAQGYLVGDSYDESIIPTKSIYELGAFLGVSFNFLGN